eukprot:TRINITY_DN10293_c0_g2_i3.p3 TRINITY_DN10293_c0_g2~~TRINITY_DN10293_c0_g2_i3.p3  ORF type:complete len:128 (-),score=6.40 TRINITY_DN10293_c0_g2_i3:183-566(-)
MIRSILFGGLKHHNNLKQQQQLCQNFSNIKEIRFGRVTFVRKQKILTRCEKQEYGKVSETDSKTQLREDSDVVFLLKGMAFSLIVAIVVKYGSVLTQFPFYPNGYVALCLVLGPMMVYALAAAWSSR